MEVTVWNVCIQIGPSTGSGFGWDPNFWGKNGGGGLEMAGIRSDCGGDRCYWALNEVFWEAFGHLVFRTFLGDRRKCLISK